MSLRQKKFGGNIVLVGDEPYLPYQRPPLSKKFLAGELPAERLYVKPESFYVDSGIETRLDTRIESIDRDDGRVSTSIGDSIAWDTLVLATGSRVRRLSIPGHDLAGIRYLRTIDDVRAIRAGLESVRSVAIVGAGYIGLEVAAVCRQLGLEVTVIEQEDRVMKRVVSGEVSDFFEREHRGRGVELRLSTAVESFTGDSRVTGVKTARGEIIPTDLVIVGIGIVANTELAANAGLAIDNGIVVDDHCRTSDPRIYAIGDCTSHPNAIYGRSLRLESVHNALEQARTAAANICGEDVAYSDVPWFWSDQYDLKLQIAGVSDSYDETVIRGDTHARSFSCVYLLDGRVIAVDAINAPRDFVQAKALIAGGTRPSPDRLADSTVMLKNLG
jgi:3-phenylpropionate/trans-cinnamate dioxygenase ferredoxin reductase subunit